MDMLDYLKIKRDDVSFMRLVVMDRNGGWGFCIHNPGGTIRAAIMEHSQGLSIDLHAEGIACDKAFSSHQVLEPKKVAVKTDLIHQSEQLKIVSL
jgi:hypothetical protein